MRKWLFGVLLVLLCASAAAQLGNPYAVLEPSHTFSVIVTPMTDKIEVDQWAEFTVVVRNHQMKTRKLVYNIAEEGVEFSSLTQPSADLVSGFLLEGGSIHTTHYLLKPNFALNTVSGRPYHVRLDITDTENGERQTVALPIEVYPKGHFAGQRINLSVSLITPPRIDPRNTYSFKVDLRNNNQYDIGDITVQLDGATVKQEFTAVLGPNEQRVVDFTVKFAPLQQPTQDTVVIRVLRAGVPIYTGTAQLEIVGYRIPFERTVQRQMQFLKTVTTITLTNKENVAEEQEVLVEAGLLRRMLSRISPEAELVEQDKMKAYRWVKNLQPGEQIVITIATSYRWPVLILFVILVLTLFFYLTRDPVSILKYAEQYRMHEGGIVELKVVLSVRNKARKILEQVQIIDKIPTITTVREGESFGTLRPYKIVHGKQGSILKWEIDRMDADEERIITYVLRAKLSIVGDISLAPALAIIRDERGSEIRIKSNEADVTSRRQV